MRKTLLTKGIILGMILTTAGFGTVEAGVFSPGNITVSGVDLSSGALIDTAGTYTVTAGDGTLTVNRTGDNTSDGIIKATTGETTFNGNLEASTTSAWRDYHYGFNVTGTGTIVNINGTTKLITNDQTTNIGSGEGQRLIHVASGATLNFNDAVTIDTYAQSTKPNGQASYTVVYSSGTDTVINFNKGLNMQYTFANYKGTSGGGNGIYATSQGTINVAGDRCILYDLSFKPDCVTAKNKGTVNITSKTVQIVGNIDFGTSNGGTVNVTFDGGDAFWFGDELNGASNHTVASGVLNATIKNGAQYIPFGTLSENPYGAKKYLSALTLEDGGIVNLYDENAQNQWKALGLDSLYDTLKTSELDYILIGDLKGSNGIFRLDMNDSDKSKTDMVYILNSTGTSNDNNIECYTTDNLENVSATNTLRFATVAAEAKDKVTFKDSENLYGNTLWDYHLLIGYSAYDANDPENIIYNGSRDGRTAAEIDALMAGGVNWYVYGLTKSPSATTLTLTDGINAGYDLATYMDRYNKRHGEAKFLDEGSNVWVRMQRGSLGRDNKYDGMYTMGQLGLEFGKENNHYGFAYEYLDGTFNLDSKYGKIDNTRKSFMLYDTVTDGKGGYLDLVARYGKVYSDLTGTTKQGASLDGDYSNHTYGLSAEYGKKFQKEGKDFFFEPQMQVAYNKVGGADYTTDNNVDAHLDGGSSFIGRLGFRVGRDINKDSNVYFKADVLREFTGGQDFTLTSGKYSYDGSVEKRGTWYDVGIGADVKLSKKASFTCDIERSFGSSLANNWEINAGLKWAF